MGGVCIIWVISTGQLDLDLEPNREVLCSDHHILEAPQYIGVEGKADAPVSREPNMG